jgi:CMP-N-acetylneuraminic acid synthetase
MFKNKSVYALIPAKKNSSRFQNKNLKKINGESLFELALKQAKKSKFIDRVYLSSDNLKIKNKTISLGCEFVKRPKKFSSSRATAAQVVLHFITQLAPYEIKMNPYIVYLQPTSPLRTFKHINQSFKILNNSKICRNVISVKKINNFFLKGFFYEKKTRITFFKKDYLNSNTQKLPNCYQPNGAIYIFSLSEFMKNKRFPSKNIKYYNMSDTESIDVDYSQDLKKAKKYLLRNN